MFGINVDKRIAKANGCKHILDSFRYSLKDDYYPAANLALSNCEGNFKDIAYFAKRG